MPKLKRILRGDRLQSLLAWLAALYIRFVYATSRWQTIGAGRGLAFRDVPQPFLGAFWHGRLMMMPRAWPPVSRVGVLISQHRDGEFIARTVAHFGISAIRGSSRKGDRDKGASSALRAILRALKEGSIVCITPDGPRGPRMRAAMGIVQVARLSGRPILPGAYAVSRRWVFESWDRFVLPLPFSRGVFVVGEPVSVPPDADAALQETLRRRVEDELNRITAEADRMCGCPPVTPAPEAGAPHARA